MRFGTYLLEKNLISKEDFLRVMIEQQKKTLPLLHFINQYCSIEEILKALSIQEKTSKTLGQIQEEYNVFDNSAFLKALDAQRMSKVALGQILLEMKTINTTELDNALRDFHNYDPQNNSKDKPKETTQTDKLEIEHESDQKVGDDAEDISEAALESLKELVEMGSFDPEEYKKLEAKAESKKKPIIP